MPALANAKHEAVLQAFLKMPARVGWKAYQAVYPNSSQRAAETAWSRLLKIAEVSARLDELQTKVAAANARTIAKSAQDVFDELAKLGFANPKDYLDDNDQFVGMRNLSRDQAAAIASLEVETVLERGDDEDEQPLQVRKVKFKLHDKRAALVDLGKHFGLFTPPQAPPGGDTANDAGAARPEGLTPLELARRIAFALEQGARQAGKASTAATAGKPKSKRRAA